MELDYQKTVPMRTYKIKLYPTQNQHHDLMRLWSACRTIYNAALEQQMWATRTGKTPTLLQLADWDLERINAKIEGHDEWLHPLGELPDRIPRDENGKPAPVAKLSYRDQAKQIPELSRARGWYGKFNSQMFQEQILQDLKRDMASYFGNLKRWRAGSGDMPKPPRFKTRRSPISIGCQGHSGVHYRSKNRVGIMGVGIVKAKTSGVVPEGLEEFRNKHCRITCDMAGQWWLHAEYKNVPLTRLLPVLEVNGAVGVDLGIVHLLTTSDGQHIVNLQPLKTELVRLQRIDKAISRLVKTYFRKHSLEHNSQNTKRYYRVATDTIKGCELRAKKNRLMRKIVNTRRTMVQQAVAALVYRYEVIVLEALNIKGLRQSRLGRSVSDVGWGLFYSELERKAEEVGSLVLFVNPAYTSQACSECGYTAKKNRVSQSVFCCGRCGHTENADVNAAKKILAKGIAEAETGSVRTTRKSLPQAAD